MKQKLFSIMLLVFGAVLGVQAEDFVYQNDFSSAEGLTIVGDGSFVDNDRFGKVFQNLASTTPRSNYLLLPADLLSHSVESKALTIGFWVSAENAGESAAYGWAPLFTAYEKKNSPNSWPMMALQYRGVTQVNCAGWTDNVDAQNVKGVNTLYHFDSDWLADKEWHYYTAVFEGESCKVYFDGELKNEWNVALVADRTQQGLFSNGADLKYICLGGNQAWDWNDIDPGFAFANFYLSNKALAQEDISALMEETKGNTGSADPGTPAITFEAGAVERTITVGLNAAGTVKVDWGDGSLVEKNATGAYDGWDNALEFSGTPSGTVKIYGEGITFLEAFTKMTDGAVVGGITSIDLSNATTITELDLHQNNLTSLDVSKLTALEKLTIGVNDMETIDLLSNTALTTFDANNTADGKLTSLDLSNNTKLVTLKANYNKISSIDLSNNTSLKNIYLLGNGLTSVDFGNNTTAKIYISLNNNKLESLDVTALTGLSNGSLLVMNNDLTELKHGAVKTLNITGNKFDLPGLYEVIQNVTTPTYASEQNYEISATIDGSIDLSSQAIVNGEASTIVWKTESGTVLEEDVDYTVENGVYTFISEQTEKVYAEMSNPTALPKLTTPIKTTLAKVIASGEAGEVDNSELLAEIEEAKKLLGYDFAYYDKNTDDPGKALVDAIRSTEDVAENATSQKKIDKAIETLKEAELTYGNTVLENEIAESESLLALTEEDDELAKSLAEAVETAKGVLADDTSVPANKLAWANMLDNYQKEWLAAQLTEKVDVATFEDLTLDAESFWQGIYEEERDEDEIGICYNTFKSGSFQFDNYYSPEYGGFWGNFAYSNQTSSSYESLADQFHAVTGGGHESATFGVAFPQGGSVTFMDNAEGTVIPGFYITNSAYAYTSMLNGDAYAKKFAQGDWFKLTITGLDADGKETGTKEFYLADLRDADSSKHFIVNDWRYVDLSGLGKVKSLKFMLDSSDTGSWGINTPGYFCLDDFGANGIETQPAGNIPTGISGVAVYENAANTPVYNLNGQRVNGNAKGIVIKNGKKYIVK